MKITRKILENIIKEEARLVILEKKLHEAIPVPLAIAGAKLAKGIAVGIAGEAVFSRFTDALGLGQDDSKYLENLLDKSEERVILHVMGQLIGAEKKLNKKIQTLNDKIQFLEAFIEDPRKKREIPIAKGETL